MTLKLLYPFKVVKISLLSVVNIVLADKVFILMLPNRLYNGIYASKPMVSMQETSLLA